MSENGELNPVPTEDVSQKEQPSTNAETEEKSETQPKQDEQGTAQAQKEEALTLEKVQKMIADAAAEAVAQAKDTGRRELQSQQDRNKAEAARLERRARTAEAALKATQKTLEEVDPDAASKAELARYKVQEQELSTVEQQEEAEKAQQAFYQQFQDNITQFITGLEIDVKDKRIDWATDAKTLLEVQQRVLKSVVDIQSEKLKEYKDLEKRLKDEDKKKADEDKREKNSVDTATSAGEVAKMSDTDFYTKYGLGELPYTKANKERADKIAKTRE